MVGNKALARISELGVHKFTLGVNWMSNSFSSHCSIHKIYGYKECPKSAIGCQKDTRTPPLAEGLVGNKIFLIAKVIYNLEYYMMYIIMHGSVFLFLFGKCMMFVIYAADVMCR